ncbi:hypothetical protein DFJ73DRAFT_958321 [Zopfochytrium polystomum]|nr:hypothetical protein DFJ73DRAFT_958321 [Zopfochytrium polystomum]
MAVPCKSSPIAAACFPEAVGVHKTERKYPTKGRTYCCASNAWGGGAQQQGQTEEVTRCRWLFRRKRQSHHTRHRWAIGVNGWMEGQRPRARKSVSFASFGWWRTHGAPHPGWGWLAFREKERGRVTPRDFFYGSWQAGSREREARVDWSTSMRSKKQKEQIIKGHHHPVPSFK